ncbi:MAG: class I SAM-dependent methyltransferase, partial [Deltaproteobacteria bacterium]|nr:class I SAM-dependent methyltransferase [Deltaproteobacteria bacterium]
MKGESLIKKNINFDIIAEYYDILVTVDVDISFWVEEARKAKGPVLELMCGTGRISVPLIEAEIPLTCVDYSEGLLRYLREKIKKKNLKADVFCMDVRELHLKNMFDLIFIGFNSFSEIIDKKD